MTGNGLGFGKLFELAQKFKAVDARQAQIEQDEVEMLLGARASASEASLALVR